MENKKNIQIDPRLEKLTITLKNSLRESKIKEGQAGNKTVLNSWTPYPPEEVLEDPLFYEKPITQPPLLNEEQFLTSLKDKNVPQEIIEKLCLVNVDYRGFDDQIYHGQIVIHKDLESSIKRVFKRILLETNFPMTSVLPISMFNWNSSSRLNNCGAFDWRSVLNSDEISDHCFGAAIDMSSVLNPWVREGFVNSPNFPYDKNKRGTLHADSDVVRIFEEEGWKWGGRWKKSTDGMHFYRPEIGYKYYGKVEVEE